MARKQATGDFTLSVLDERFTDARTAALYLESVRWPDGAVCPHCGNGERKHYLLKDEKRRVWKCAACRKQFTVTIGTIFERSHIPLNKWLLAFYLLCSSKKGMSAHQLHRMLGVTYKSAWFMAHRIRYAMEQPPFTARMSGIVEADETYVGGKERNRKRQSKQKKTGRGVGKTPVLSLVQRGGEARSFRVANVTGDELRGAIRRHVDEESRVITDAFKSYTLLREDYAQHDVINHGDGEYVRGDVHTNTVEGYFSILKRGIDGTYHHISEAHLPRYLAEFDYRYNTRAALGFTDAERTRRALLMSDGKRLLYADTRGRYERDAWAE